MSDAELAETREERLKRCRLNRCTATTCVQCGRVWEASEPGKLFCSGRCAQLKSALAGGRKTALLRVRKAPRPSVKCPRPVAPAGMKYCRRCEADLPLEDFAIRRASSDGRQSYCRGCHNKPTGEANRHCPACYGLAWRVAGTACALCGLAFAEETP
jgi:hypothetical protein